MIWLCLVGMSEEFSHKQDLSNTLLCSPHQALPVIRAWLDPCKSALQRAQPQQQEPGGGYLEGTAIAATS